MNHRAMQRFVVLAFSLFAFKAALAELPQRGLLPPVKVIDIHTHIFNARDLPLQGILGSFGGKEPIPFILKEAILEFTESDEAKVQISSVTMASKVENPQLTLNDEQRATLEKFVGTTGIAIRSAFAEGQPSPDTALVAAALSKLNFPADESEMGDPQMQSARTNNVTIAGLLRFVGIMCTNHRGVAEYLRTNAYPKVDLFVHHLMDMEIPYNDPPKTAFSEQMRFFQDQDSALGNFLHFVAFDPFRRADALLMVQQGYAQGAIGIKFYPPSGYRATSNAFPPAPTDPEDLARWNRRYLGWQGLDLDKVNEAMFCWAEANQIPIMTHCTPKGFQAVKGYGIHSDPYYWAKVLAKYPRLRLCFGHGGGDAYWLSDPGDDKTNMTADPTQPPVDRDPQPKPPTQSDSKPVELLPNNLWLFGKQVVDLCLKYENVYFDSGYLEELMTTPGRSKLQLRLQHDLKLQSADGRWSLGDKFIYGTDWHMIIKQANYKTYTDCCDDLICAVDQGRWRKAFFARNAVRFLRLDDSLVQARYPKQVAFWQPILDSVK